MLLLDKRVDEFAIMMLHDFDKTEFKSISSDESEELSKEEKDKLDALTAENKRLLDNLTNGLKGIVDEVNLSSKLINSPVCISTKQGLSLGMEKTLNEQPGLDEDHQIKSSKILELNPNHPLFEAFKKLNDDSEQEKYASLLYDEALLLEGFDIKDKKSFVSKLNELFLKAFNK